MMENEITMVTNALRFMQFLSLVVASGVSDELNIMLFLAKIT